MTERAKRTDHVQFSDRDALSNDDGDVLYDDFSPRDKGPEVNGQKFVTLNPP